MSIFNLFKNKKNNDLNLLEWQNIIQHSDSDKLLMSKEHLNYSTLNIYLPNTLRIIDDCVNLVNNTKTLDVFFFRFNELIKYLNELSKLEKFINFKEPLPSTQLNEVLSHKEIIYKQFIDRYFENALTSADKLKTKNGKINRLNKTIQNLLNYKDLFSSNNLEYINNLISVNNITLQNINLSKPYYLDDEYISMDDIINELKAWSKTGSLNIDSIYELKVKELDEIKKSIVWTKDIPNDNIKLCSTGLTLSIELCNYCIEKEYSLNKFIRKTTKEYYTYFTEQLEHWTIFNSFKEAEYLEKNGFLSESLELYLNILKKHRPLGSLYYETPFYLAVKIFDNKTAYSIYDILNTNFNTTNDKTFKVSLENLEKIITTLPSKENMYIKIKSDILSIIKDTPNIIQSDLYKEFNIDYKENIRFIIYYLEKSNIIKRKKKGRSYILSLNE